MPDGAARLDALCARHRLPPTAREHLGALLLLLERDPHAPTAVRSPREAVDVHCADSLVALEIDRVQDARRLADIGSGAGFPGLPLAAALPHAQVALVESAGRKAAWLARAAETIGVGNVEVVNARAEAWPEGLDRQDAVTTRALDTLPVLVEYAAPLLRVGGVLVAWKGRRASGEEADGAAAAARLGMAPMEVRPVTPYPGSRDRHLHLYEKVSPTPEGFPRGPGRARKRPIGASR